ncbi:hypothetical protein SOVF_043570 [Spinacia oleracea]|nr:hypothetical protein SOVF_043570 [Spinacia oleracea]
MESERVYLDELNANRKGYTVKVKVIEKGELRCLRIRECCICQCFWKMISFLRVTKCEAHCLEIKLMGTRMHLHIRESMR